MIFEYYSQTDPGLIRENNEDSVALDPVNQVVVLADGMGGYNAGEVASAMATGFIHGELGRWMSEGGHEAHVRELKRAMEICVDNANRSIMRNRCCCSVRSDRRNLRRAGTLKNRSFTSMLVPTGCGLGDGSENTPLSAVTAYPTSLDAVRDTTRMRDTDAMLGSASPRKPSVPTRSKSSMLPILLVA